MTSPPTTPTASTRVLVVDDEVDLRTLTARRLQQAGFDVATARDGEDGWDSIIKSAPDVVVLDVRMPRLDGIELTRRIRDDGALANVAIVIVTASVERHHEDAVMAAGVDAFLRKPWAVDDLVEAIEVAVRARTGGGV